MQARRTFNRAPPTEPSEVRPRPQPPGPPGVPGQVGNSCRSRRDETPFGLLTSRDSATVGGKVGQQVPAWTNVAVLSHRPSTLVGMRLRYRYRLDPDPTQRRALAKAFGCA